MGGVLHGNVQALLDQLMMEEGYSQASQAAGGFSSVVTVQVLGQQLCDVMLNAKMTK